MNILGLEINWRKRAPQNLQGVHYYNGYGPWWGPVRESYAGAWQQNVVVAPTQTLVSFPPVFAAITGIASDISKMRVKLSRIEDGIWVEQTENLPWLPLLRNPNRYQDIGQFLESWLLSLLLYGNTYILKGRNDLRGLVTALYPLHPNCVKALVAEDGSVYYEISKDNLSGLEENVTVPASEIIHDRFNCLWHPLVGVSPLYACGLPATLGNSIQGNSANFFQNQAMPGGVLTAPGAISDETAGRLKSGFETKFSGANRGRLFVAGDGLTFQPFTMKADEAQTSEQLQQAKESVAVVFHYPLWKLGGAMPPYTKPDLAQTLYYSDCLQSHIVRIERRFDNGLELPLSLGTEFDVDELMRMDIDSLFESNNKAADWLKLNEQRFRANYAPLPTGGDTVYKQQQDFSIEALAKRDAKEDPFASKSTTPTVTPQQPAQIAQESEDAAASRELVIDEDEMRSIYEADIRRDLIHA